jgi:hypothetical protein
MNSAINYYSAAQRHTDAIREARRNPLPVIPPPPAHEPDGWRGPAAVLARRARRVSLRPLLGL